MRDFVLIAAAAVALGAPARLSGQDPARALLDRAITAAGGVRNLQRYPVLGWHGTASINASGRIVRIEGDWRVRQPRELTDDEPNGVVGSVVHLAYHLGAIRQIDRATRRPSARD